VNVEALVRLPAWRRFAACRGRGRLFYATDPVSQATAVTICAGCGARDDCADEAAVDETDERYRFGVRGGLTAAERGRRCERGPQGT
jgi:hypothetical protein